MFTTLILAVATTAAAYPGPPQPPRCPEEAIKARVQGTVYVEALIDEEGAVADARPDGAFPLLAAAALESIRQWHFEPTSLYGKRVPVVLGIRVEFVLTLGRD